MKRLFFLFALCAGVLRAFPQGSDEYSAELQQGACAFNVLGSWRGVFELRSGVEVPINFEIRIGPGGEPTLYFRNSNELFAGGLVRQTPDSLFIPLNQFDNELAFQIRDGGLSGVLRRQDGTGHPIAITAMPATTWRFKENGVPPARDLSGTYAVTFTAADGKQEKSVGLFSQQGVRLNATFLHVTGDSRFLEGIVEADSFRLSSFIGSGPSLYIGNVQSDGSITGQNIGVRGETSFYGRPDSGAKLPDAYALTLLKPGYTALEFSFPDVNGRLVSLRDPKFRNKVVVVTIGGTWCPNCIDETAFLAPWYEANHSRDVEIISIQYERRTDSAFIRKALDRMRQRYDIHYDQIVGGIADKAVVAKSLPSLNTFLAFPTTIFIDREGRVARIHTGFNGPATGRLYDEFKKEFSDEINELLRQ